MTCLLSIPVEGAVDRFAGRPLERNPYVRTVVPDCWQARQEGCQEADSLLEHRGQEEARWLREAA
jgi:hypothetical protein